MFENENEVQAQEQQAQPEVQKAPPAPIEENTNRNLRKAKEQAERERDELARRLQEVEARGIQKSSDQDDDSLTIGADDLVEGKHIRQLERKLTKKLEKEFEEKLRRHEQKSTANYVETRIKTELPDFDKVVSAENIERLREEFPEFATTLNASTDLYSKAVSAYKIIKKLGIVPDTSFDAAKERVHANLAKPKTVTGISPQQGESPLEAVSDFMHLTPELKKKRYQQMLEATKKY